MRNWEFTNYTCKEMYVSHIAFFIKWLSQSAHSQNESSQNGLQPTEYFILGEQFLSCCRLRGNQLSEIWCCLASKLKWVSGSCWPGMTLWWLFKNPWCPWNNENKFEVYFGGVWSYFVTVLEWRFHEFCTNPWSNSY